MKIQFHVFGLWISNISPYFYFALSTSAIKDDLTELLASGSLAGFKHNDCVTIAWNKWKAKISLFPGMPIWVRLNLFQVIQNPYFPAFRTDENVISIATCQAQDIFAR